MGSWTSGVFVRKAWRQGFYLFFSVTHVASWFCLSQCLPTLSDIFNSLPLPGQPWPKSCPLLLHLSAERVRWAARADYLRSITDGPWVTPCKLGDPCSGCLQAAGTTDVWQRSTRSHLPLVPDLVCAHSVSK